MNHPNRQLTPRQLPKKPEGFLERMQGKSKGEKNRIAFFSAVGITGVIALVWMVSLSIKTSNDGVVSQVATATDETGSVLSSVLSDLKGQAASVFSSRLSEEIPAPADIQSIVDTATNEPRPLPTPQPQPEPEKQPRMVLIATSSSASTSATKTPAAE